MTPEQEIKLLKEQVAELMKWKEEKSTRQLNFPLDEVSVQALKETLRLVRLERINVRDIYFTATESSPTIAGQMRFFNDGATQNMRINTSYGAFTGSVDLTAV